MPRRLRQRGGSLVSVLRRRAQGRAGRRAAPGNGDQVYIRWIDGFVREIAPFIYVREEDSLLILRPNKAHRLNPTALALLKATLSGEPVERFLRRVGDTPQRRQQIHDFFCDVRALLVGCLREGQARRAVETVPFRRPFNVLPVLSEIAVTYRCNLSCTFCYAGCVGAGGPGCHGGPAGREMSTRDIERVLRVIWHEAKVPTTSFTGGEPAVRPDLPRLVRYARRLGMRVNLITNGTLITPECARALREHGLNSAQVSVEGPTAEVHERLTRVPGSFEATCAGVRNLAEAGITAHTHTTISRGNIDCVEGVVDLAARLGRERLSMNMIMPCGSAALEPEANYVAYEEIGEAVLRVRDRARRLGLEFMWYSPTPYCLFNPVAEGLGNKACAACDGLLSVAPDGGVLPCSSVTEPVGNLLREPFPEVWSSAAARWWQRRDYAPDLCRDCNLLDLCGAACPIYWDAMGTRELRPIRNG